MRFTILFLVAVVSLAFAVGCQPSAEEPAEPDTMEEEEPAMSDEDMLDVQLDAFETAFNTADAAGLAALFTEEGDLVGPDGAHFHGHDAIQGRYAELFSGMYQGATVSVDATSMTFPTPDAAIVNGTYHIDGMKNADGEDVPLHGIFMNVVVKEGGEWKIHCLRPMLPLPAPSAEM